MPADRVSTLAAVVSLFLLVLNDRFFKQHPNWLTGKLSDVTGLFLVPYPLVGIYLFVKNRFEKTAWVFHPLFYSALVALVFILAKTRPEAARLLESVWPWPSRWGPSRIVADPTDLLTLPFLYVGYRAAWHFWPQETRQQSPPSSV